MRLIHFAAGLLLGAASTLPWHWAHATRLGQCRTDVAVVGVELDAAAWMLRRTGDELRAHGAVLEAASRQCGGR